MRKTLLISAVLTALLLFSVSPYGQDNSNAQPEGIIIQPNEQDFTIEINTNHQVYSPTERLQISVELSHDAFVYIYDINPEGKVNLIYPNGFSKVNFLKAGKHRLPATDEYSLLISGPFGVERLQALALLKPMPILELTSQNDLDVHVFPQLSADPVELKPQVQEMIEIHAEPGEWAADWTELHITPPLATLSVNSYPEGAYIFVDDQFVGQSPLQLSVTPGRVNLRMSRDGFSDWTARFDVANRDLKEFNIALQPAQSPVTSQPVQPIPNTPGGVPLPTIGSSTFQLGFDIGATSTGVFSTGFDLGFTTGLGIGASMTFDEDAVPQYYNIGRPVHFPRERVFKMGPETEAFVKLSVPITDGLLINMGGGVAIQERVHIAVGQSTYVINSADIVVVPNGYRDTTNFWTVFGGIGVQLGNAIFNISNHNRRGWVAGFTIRF